MRDPLAGLTYGEETGEESAPFEEPAADSLTMDFNPNHDPINGQFTSGGGGGEKILENPLTSEGERGKIQSSQKPSASGANKFKKGFSKHNLNEHWGGTHDHSKQYPGWTKEQYAQRALELVQKPVGGDICGYINTKGQVVRYDNDTNDYVVGIPRKGIGTMFKPRLGKLYFDRLKERDEVKDE